MPYKMGMQIGMLSGSYEQALDQFSLLQQQFSFSSAELQLESSIYDAYFFPEINRLPDVEILGVHLPFMGLDLISDDADKRKNSLQTIYHSISSAADCGSSYVVFHARTQSSDSMISQWTPVLADLAEKSHDNGVRFCLENADSLYDTTHIHDILHELPEIFLCLDIGHLYEHTFNPLTRYFPLFHDSRLTRALENLHDHIACIHIHNHDGFYAHRLLSEGKIDFTPITKLHAMDFPLILESDYRNVPLNTISHDINYLKELIT
jgi:sugar phosphate isomerase/epimerase